MVVLLFVVVQPSVHGSDDDHLALVRTFINEAMGPLTLNFDRATQPFLEFDKRH